MANATRVWNSPSDSPAIARLDQNSAVARGWAQEPGERAPRHEARGGLRASSYAVAPIPTCTRRPWPARTAMSLIGCQSWYAKEFIPTVQQRGAAIIEARGALQRSISSERGDRSHARLGARNGGGATPLSMGVYSDGSYGIEKGLIYSFPTVCQNGDWQIVQGRPINDFSRERMKAQPRRTTRRARCGRVSAYAGGNWFNACGSQSASFECRRAFFAERAPTFGAVFAVAHAQQFFAGVCRRFCGTRVHRRERKSFQRLDDERRRTREDTRVDERHLALRAVLHHAIDHTDVVARAARAESSPSSMNSIAILCGSRATALAIRPPVKPTCASGYLNTVFSAATTRSHICTIT